MRHIAWLVPSLLEGSGGHRTILQHAAYLQERGCRTTIYLESRACVEKGETPSQAIQRLFQCQFADAKVGWNEIAPCDAVFATIWYSARLVRDLPFNCRRFYFIQDWEAYFNPMGDAYLEAENSYRYGLIPITIGRWLKHELRQRFGVSAAHFDFCADLDVYRRIPGAPREKAIAFICQPEKPRRCARLGVEALGIVKHHIPDVRIYLFGSNHYQEVWFRHDSLGLISIRECNDLYNRVAIGLCISSSNPSRIPFEMMAAGLPVVELYRSNTIHDFPSQAMLLCDQTAESLAQGMIELIESPERRSSMELAATEFMKQRHTDVGLAQFGAAFDQGYGGNGQLFEQTVGGSLYEQPPVLAAPFVCAVSSTVRKTAHGIAAKRQGARRRLKKWIKALFSRGK